MTATQAPLVIKPIGRHVGAEVFGFRGVDDNEEQFEQLRKAFLDYSVLVLRGVDLTPEQHVTYSKNFGVTIVHPTASNDKFVPELREVLIVAPQEKTGYFVEGERWHSDLSCMDAPPKASHLLARVLPSIGGDTMFASGYAIYESLSKPLQSFLETLRAEHIGANYRKSYLTTDDGPKAVHPVVVTHPETGRKSIFVNPIFTTRIMELRGDESDALLNVIFQKMNLAEFQCRVRWEPGSMTMWDNRCTFHRALNDYLPAKRLMHRTTLEGIKPVLARAE